MDTQAVCALSFWTHILTHTLFQKKGLRVGGWQLCHPMTPHSDGDKKKNPCFLLTVPQSYSDIPQYLTWSMAGWRFPRLRAFNISMLVSDVVVLKGAEGVSCGLMHERDRNISHVVWRSWPASAGQNILLSIWFYCFFVCVSLFTLIHTLQTEAWWKITVLGS